MGSLYTTYSLFGVSYAAIDYTEATNIVMQSAEGRRSFGVSALATHGLITAVQDPVFMQSLNTIQLIVPDGQAIRWALNSLFNAGLKDRVYGPTLTLHVLKAADEREMRVYLFGSTEATVKRFAEFIRHNYPRVAVCGVQADRFRDATPEEDAADIHTINQSGANIILVGRGCPRQEKWVAAHLGKINAAMLAVGAAFDFHAGLMPQAPRWVQDAGFEWLFRLIQEPRRLWKRYLFTNPIFIYLFLKHKLFHPKAQ